ncbi:MAG: hypothetical protein FGF52_03510 [Candidatus Brockarchaeota archaeon]|nr:hypothetical protein [Candidatus Brockarchaeota archaeon]
MPRMARLTVGILLISLLLVNTYIRNPSVRTIYSILLTALLAVYYLRKASRGSRP